MEARSVLVTMGAVLITNYMEGGGKVLTSAAIYTLHPEDGKSNPRRTYENQISGPSVPASHRNPVCYQRSWSDSALLPTAPQSFTLQLSHSSSKPRFSRLSRSGAFCRPGLQQLRDCRTDGDASGRRPGKNPSPLRLCSEGKLNPPPSGTGAEIPISLLTNLLPPRLSQCSRGS